MLRFFALLALAAASSLALLAARGPVAVVAPVLGPGAVIEMHKQLFAALDRGDARAVQGFVSDGDGPVSVILVDGAGRPVVADGIDGARALLGRLADERKQAGGTFTTKILKSTADCSSKDLSYGIFEYEVAHTLGDKTSTRRFVITSLVRWTSDGMRLFHAHASAAAEGPQSAVAKKD